MKLTNPLLALGFAAMPLSASLLPIHQDGPPKPVPAKAAPAQSAPAPDVGALVKQLGDKDYASRKQAFKQLEKLGASARGELEKAMKSDDPEVRWSASLLLDRLDEAQEDGAPGRLRDARRFRTQRTPEDSIQELREAMRRLEPFGLRLFDDPFHGFGQGGGELQLGPGSSFSRTTDNNGQKESLSIKVDQDGRVTAEQEKDGQKSTFQADSLEALRAEHPELLDGLGGLGGPGGVTLHFGLTRFGDPLPRARAGRSRLEKPAEEPSVREEAPRSDRPRLGVQVRPVAPDLAAWLDLEEGVGLEVVEVVANSAAEKLGVRPRDIITEINGRAISSTEDVSQALAGKDPAQAEVTVLRRGESKTLERKR